MAESIEQVIGRAAPKGSQASASAVDAVHATLLKQRLQIICRRILSLLLFVATWQIFSALPWAIQIPSPLEALRAALQLDPETFLRDIALSTYRVGLGFIVAALVGIPLGICIGSSKLIRDLVFPSVELFRPIPPIAWIPLAILFFPKIEWMIIFLTFYGSFFPIVYNTVAGVLNIRSTYIRAGKSLGASEWTLFWHVVLPAALPTIFTGLYIAIGVAWLMVVAGEMIANKGGIGAMTWQAYQTTRYPRIFVGMATIGVVGYLSSLVVRLISRAVVRWEQH
jgi:NitT/TauT family transport system permease protein